MQLNWMTVLAILVIVAGIAFFVMRRRRG